MTHLQQQAEAMSPAALPWTETELTQLVNDALKQMHSVLALARSPLANSALVKPLLVLDDVSPTADERGQALRLVIQWAVDQLAPAPVAYPLGRTRPLDDPTWRDPHWWRYNILRHRYLEPLHPDEFVEGGRFTETLMALTGIPSPDTFFDERNRAIGDVAQWLRQQMQTGQADAELRELALAEVYRPLQQEPDADALLGVAATFTEVFPRSLLVQMAEAEHLNLIDKALDYLLHYRFLQVGEAGQNLWLSPVLRHYIYRRQRRVDLDARHRRAANHFWAHGEPLVAARHLQTGGRWAEAAQKLLAVAPELVNELHGDELIQALDAFASNQLDANQLDEATWLAVQILRADLLYQRGKRDQALAACRAALRVAQQHADQARIYRRMGKLYEKHNQLHALGYYQQAEERFATTDPEFGELLKDRAWLYILRQEWAGAEADLSRALAHVPETSRELRADIYDALAALARHRRRYPDAIHYGRKALGLREAGGDLLRVAKSFNNLGLIYTDMGDHPHAIAAFHEANATYSTLGNRELAAGALLNLGMAHHFAGAMGEAVQAYQACLSICQAIDLPLVAARAHSNLVEALAEQAEWAAARRHWQIGYTLSRHAGFDDELDYYKQLAAQYPKLSDQSANVEFDAGSGAAAHSASPSPGGAATQQSAGKPAPDRSSQELPPALSEAEQAILKLAQDEGQLTTRRLVDALQMSKATATRRLADLAAQGFLLRFGEGRGTYYTLPQSHSGYLHAEAYPAGRQAEAQATDGRTAGNDLAMTAPVAQVHAWLPAQLYQHQTQLGSRYGVTGLGMLDHGDLLRLVVAFDTPVDLATFFQLEEEVARLAQCEIDLLPLTTFLARHGEEAAQRIVWVWQPAAFLG